MSTGVRNIKDFMKVDMHIHTTASDGAYAPSEVILSARENNLDVISIADHDTVDGVKKVMPIKQEAGSLVIPALELSAEYESEIHILGYGIDPYNKKMEDTLLSLRQHRILRTGKIVSKLQRLGIQITEAEIRRRNPDAASEGRPHIAALLVEKGYVLTVSEAFDRYLSRGCPAFVPKVRLSIQKCIELIRDAGGKSVLAHPKDTNLPDWLLEPLIKKMIDYGLWGLEAFHPSQVGCEQRFLSMAKRLNLFVTAGSDCHDKNPLTGYIAKTQDPLWIGIRFLSGL